MFSFINPPIRATELTRLCLCKTPPKYYKIKIYIPSHTAALTEADIFFCCVAEKKKLFQVGYQDHFKKMLDYITN